MKDLHVVYGVISYHYCAGLLDMIANQYGAEITDLWYEEHVAYCGKCARGNGCEEMEYSEGSGTTLIGYKRIKYAGWEDRPDAEDVYTAVEGPYRRYAYVIDPEADFSAIVPADDNDVHITRSKWVAVAPYCSPCAPNQGYLRDAVKPELYNPVMGTPEMVMSAQVFMQTRYKYVLAYAPPPELFWDEDDFDTTLLIPVEKVPEVLPQAVRHVPAD